MKKFVAFAAVLLLVASSTAQACHGFKRARCGGGCAPVTMGCGQCGGGHMSFFGGCYKMKLKIRSCGAPCGDFTVPVGYTQQTYAYSTPQSYQTPPAPSKTYPVPQAAGKSMQQGYQQQYSQPVQQAPPGTPVQSNTVPVNPNATTPPAATVPTPPPVPTVPRT